jgi:hypothetical protein
MRNCTGGLITCMCVRQYACTLILCCGREIGLGCTAATPGAPGIVVRYTWTKRQRVLYFLWTFNEFQRCPNSNLRRLSGTMVRGTLRTCIVKNNCNKLTLILSFVTPGQKGSVCCIFSGHSMSSNAAQVAMHIVGKRLCQKQIAVN